MDQSLNKLTKCIYIIIIILGLVKVNFQVNQGPTLLPYDMIFLYDNDIGTLSFLKNITIWFICKQKR